MAVRICIHITQQTDAMKVTKTEWGPGVLQEALKFWFYAEVASILLSLYDLFIIWTVPDAPTKSKPKVGTSEKGDSKAADATQPKAVSLESMKIYKKLLIDCCDILIPGSGVGWISIDPIILGVTGCISTLVSMSDVWVRVQGARKAL